MCDTASSSTPPLKCVSSLSLRPDSGRRLFSRRQCSSRAPTLCIAALKQHLQGGEGDGAQPEPASFSSLCARLCDSQAAAKPTKSEISALLKSGAPLPNPLKAVYRGAKSLVRSDLLPSLPPPPPTHSQSLDYTIKIYIFLHLKALILIKV